MADWTSCTRDAWFANGDERNTGVAVQAANPRNALKLVKVPPVMVCGAMNWRSAVGFEIQLASRVIWDTTALEGQLKILRVVGWIRAF